MRSFGEMAIVAENKIKNKLVDWGNTVMLIGNAKIHEKDVYHFVNMATKKIKFSRVVIWLNKTYSQHMGISQVDFITSEVEKEEVDEKEKEELERKDYAVPPFPITNDDHTEQLMDVTTVAKSDTIVVPYPKPTRELSCLSYGTVGLEPKKISMDLKGLQQNHIAYINRQVIPSTKDK
jgi:hypothetical protein